MFSPEFDGLYIQGYTAALQDLKQLFTSSSFNYDLKRHNRKKNQKEFEKLFNVLIKGRSILRENPDAFIRCNNDIPEGYEFFDGNRKKVIQF